MTLKTLVWEWIFPKISNERKSYSLAQVISHECILLIKDLWTPINLISYNMTWMCIWIQYGSWNTRNIIYIYLLLLYPTSISEYFEKVHSFQSKRYIQFLRIIFDANFTNIWNLMKKHRNTYKFDRTTNIDFYFNRWIVIAKVKGDV